MLLYSNMIGEVILIVIIVLLNTSIVKYAKLCTSTVWFMNEFENMVDYFLVMINFIFTVGLEGIQELRNSN